MERKVRLAGDPSLGLSRCCPQRFIESSCVKCHHQVTDIPQAKKLQAGYQRIVKYGCTGCHTIGGEGSFGPDLTDERHGRPQPRARRLQGHEGVGTQVDQEPARLPARFADAAVLRLDQQRQPRTTCPRATPRSTRSPITCSPRARRLPTSSHPRRKTDPPSGKELFLQKGCLACHQHRPYEASSVQPADRKSINPDYKPDPAATYDPKNFPESVRTYAQADYGPNLVEHRRQVPVPARQGTEVAVQLDPEPREVPSQEPDAQASAHLPGRRRHRLLDDLGSRRMAGQGRGPARRGQERRRRPSTTWSSST